MCGIVGAIAERNVTPILLEGLRRLEYRGYDSAGIAVLDNDNCINRVRRVGKVKELADALEQTEVTGKLGVAHTRWATHGEPSEKNAHPHVCNKSVVIVHNGIIENHSELREQQNKNGFSFTSETDTEVAAHQIEYYLKQEGDLLSAVRLATADFEGAYALGVMSNGESDRLIASRRGSPLVIGVGIGEYFIASDAAALLPVTRRFIYLEEGDIADIRTASLVIYNADGEVVNREIKESALSADATSKGEFRHYMLKEVFEQPSVLVDILEGRVINGKLSDTAFGVGAEKILDQVKAVQIIACGTSYHAGLVARYWLEAIAGVPCRVEVASEYRYRKTVLMDDTLVVTISQSGETADTLAALRAIKEITNLTLSVCNVPESSLVRESELKLMTRAGPEIGVASTKAFTTQLVALLMLVVALGKRRQLSEDSERSLFQQAQGLPALITRVLQNKDTIDEWAETFTDLENAIFIGRGTLFPIALEGALKLKEISYIHADAYPAGELKHGPIALIDQDMPTIAIASMDGFEGKIKSNIREILARGGEVYLFADERLDVTDLGENCHVMKIPAVEAELAPILFAVPLQLFSYFVAVRKGTDVDQPRNLAKSVTVE
ncbi:MAG: glutamine--fructose-6-phosphate transaminase (isomerizing) [Gammaproteobacteria bacterium]|jgi:glucosamine--fructose-6-phosphate aminotransferase (isomerizing)|nr:glutamine--fructose-6-phosphate transaminase (isomerizing) [Gammaproteobacteria bacterium]